MSGDEATTASRLWNFLKLELAPFPGRVDALLRFLASITLVILIAVFLDVPFLTLGIIIIFFTLMENTVFTLLAGVMIVSGGCLSGVLGIVMLNYTLDFPLLRILATTAIVFAGMWFFRASSLGSIGFMVALSIIFAQSFFDQLPDPETLLRVIMWTWVVMAYSVAVTVAVSLLLRPARPEDLLRSEVGRQVSAAMAQLAARLDGSPPPPLPPLHVERSVISVNRNFTFAVMGDKKLKARKLYHQARIGAATRVYTAAAKMAFLPAGPAPDELRPVLLGVMAGCSALLESIRSGAPFLFGEVTAPPADSPSPALAAELREMAEGLSFIASDAAMAAEADPQGGLGGLLADDAFTNPAYARFAFKTTFAAMFCYGLYTALNWDGIHTCMLTCIIIALPSLGAVSQKGVLRISGCLAGSFLTFLATIFIVPHLESVVGFLILSLCIIGLGGWVASGSERSNYAGLQIAFAYVLALCANYYPTSDLVEIRDRLFGIIIGVGVSTAVQGLMWPERDADSLPGALAKLLHSLADLARPHGDGDGVGGVQSRCWTDLGACRELQIRVVLEPDWTYRKNELEPMARRLLARAQDMILAAAHARAVLAGDPGAAAVMENVMEGVAERLDEYADFLGGREPALPPALPFGLKEGDGARGKALARLVAALESFDPKDVAAIGQSIKPQE